MAREWAPAGLRASPIVLLTYWGPEETAIVKGLHIHYLYVDRRLSDSLPYLGYYFSQGETAKPTRLTVADLTKFAHVPGLKVGFTIMAP